MSKLVVNLIGRICVVRSKTSLTAVFLNTRQTVGIREHRPLLSTSLDKIPRQATADASLVTIGEVVNGDASTPLADTVGIWSVSGCDIEVGELRPWLRRPRRCVTSVNWPT